MSYDSLRDPYLRRKLLPGSKQNTGTPDHVFGFQCSMHDWRRSLVEKQMMFEATKEHICIIVIKFDSGNQERRQLTFQS
jgi:hypothetical protein